MKAIVVGRHGVSELVEAGIEILGGKPRPIMFPATTDECVPVIGGLMKEADEKKAKLLLQAVPAQLGIAIASLIWRGTLSSVGAVISIPGPRLTATSQEFASDDVHAIEAIEAAVKFVNSRAKVEKTGPYQIKVTVDPFSPFAFSHIQWFDGTTSHWTLRGFFANHGLPMKWFDEDGDIFINENDSNEYSDIWGGDEVSISADDIEVRDHETLVVRMKTDLTTDFFHVKAYTFARDITKAMDGIG